MNWKASKPFDGDVLHGEEAVVFMSGIGWPELCHVKSIVNAEFKRVLEAIEFGNER